MNQSSPKKKKPVQLVSKPYLKGEPLDKSCGKTCLFFCLSTFGSMLGLLLVGGMMMWSNQLLLIGSNVLLLLCVYAIYFYSGASKGTVAVNAGEILYNRREKGLSVDETERRACYHRAKGFLIGLVGSIPVFVCAVVLACTAQRQLTGYGVLPGWTSGILSQADVGNALAYYQIGEALTLTDVLRMMIRMMLMPLVNLIGAENQDGLLLLERFSPLLVLLPAMSYGIGYTRGVAVRAKVHTDIAQSKRRARKKQQKQQKQRQPRQPKGPEQLN